jgi:hypothetical protein
MAEEDWGHLGRLLYDALGVVARESDLCGDAAYGEALRRLVERGHLVARSAHLEELAQLGSVIEGNNSLSELHERTHLEEMAALRQATEGQLAELRGGVADELRAKAGHAKLGHHVRRGVLLAADWISPPGHTRGQP